MAGGSSVTIECWVLLVIVLFVFVCRIASRRILLGSFKKLQIDDYIMTLVIGCFIIVVISIYTNIIWGNNYVTAEQVVGWTKQQFDEAILGSKWAVAMEVCKVSCVWGCKTCLLILYSNMTKGLPKYHRAVMIVAGYIAVGYVVVIVCYFAVWCRPFQRYWDTIPLDADHQQCTTYRNHMINDACWNISSDAMMLCLPIPIVIKAQVPLKRKLVLVGIFSLGALVILCALLNRIQNFTAPWGSLVYLNWYAGETATAVIVANVPHLWPLVSRVFKLGAFKQPTSGHAFNRYTLDPGSGGGPSAVRRRNYDKGGYIRSESEERTAIEDMQWGLGKKSAIKGDLELGSYSITVAAGGVETTEELASTHTRGDHKDQIIKTVQIQQYASDD